MKRIFIAIAFATLTLSALTVSAQTQSREDIFKKIAAKRAELLKLENAFLAPSPEDQTAYADFLRTPDTGLIRLLPREKYDAEGDRINSEKMTLRGGGAYYSFARLTHEYGYGSDIELAQGFLSTGFAGANYGLMTNLGDVPLENVSLESEAVPFLVSYAPADDLPKARIEQRKWGESATAEGTTYTRRLLLKKDSTYLLRSVNYDTSDVLVAFRVVSIDKDNSATILWKLLKKYPTPKLARN